MAVTIQWDADAPLLAQPNAGTITKVYVTPEPAPSGSPTTPSAGRPAR